MRDPVMKKLVCAMVVLFAVSPALAQFPDQSECGTSTDVPNVAMNCPDMFAWQKFVEVVTPVGGQVTFQTWSSDSDTFPCPPADAATCKANPQAPGCPVWPAPPKAAAPLKAALASSGTQRSARTTSSLAALAAQRHPDSCLTNPAGSQEIVYRDPATFGYIVQQGLWYVEGVEAAFQRGLDFDFPVGAIEVKTNWYVLSEEQIKSGRYFTMRIRSKQNGNDVEQTLGLVAMHLSTKDLPNWFWSTFEHVDNPGRCDFIGCHDSFGVEPADQPARNAPLCETYPPGELTPALRKLLSSVDPVFQNYRLKGAMVDFTTPTGSPVLLGNSVTEAGFVPTASCMTCHSRATTQGLAGSPNGLSPYPGVAGFTDSGQSFNGVPDPSWYYSTNHPRHRWSVQTDFVWAIPFKANSIYATAACCSNGPPSGPPGCQCQADGVCNSPN